MQFSRPVCAFVVLLFSILTSFGQPWGRQDADKLWKHLERGETERAFWMLHDAFKRAGAEMPTEGSWKLKLTLQDHKEIINQYINADVRIRVSRMMSQDEAAGYWENWSRVLTAGKFDQRRFFADDRERQLLANFNVLALSAHELGHYLDYMYKVHDRFWQGGVFLNQAPLNCTEGFADRFAAAFVNEISADPRFAKLRERYAQLIEQMNSDIPLENRYSFASLEHAVSMCGEVDLMLNGLNPDGRTVNDNFFRQYASAYFNRHRLMLGDPGYSSLAKVMSRDVVEPYYSRMEYAKFPFELTTIREFEGKIGREIFLGGDDFREYITFERGLDEALDGTPKKVRSHHLSGTVLTASGEPRFVDIRWTSNRRIVATEEYLMMEPKFSLSVTGEAGRKLIALDPVIPVKLRNSFNISKFLMASEDEFILIMTPFDVAKRFDHLVVLHGRRKNGKWNATFRKFTLPGVSDADEIGANWFTDPSGKLWLVRQQKADREGNSVFTPYELERSDLKPGSPAKPFTSKSLSRDDRMSMKGGLWRRYFWDEGLFGDGSGRFFVAGSEKDTRGGSDANLFLIDEMPRLLVGSFDGIRDASDPRVARLSAAVSPRFTAKDEIIFIDHFEGKNYLRKIKIRPAIQRP